MKVGVKTVFILKYTAPETAKKQNLEFAKKNFKKIEKSQILLNCLVNTSI